MLRFTALTLRRTASGKETMRRKNTKPLAEKTFGNTLRQSERKWGIAYDKNLDIGYGKRARGYRGVHTLVNADYQ